MSIYKSCDIRGEYGADLLPEHAHRLGAAIAHMLGKVQILVSGDGRLSTPLLKQTLISSLVDHGCQVFDLGVLPTPAFYFARRHLKINPGIMVTASHNPAQDNGFKIVLGKFPIREEDIQKIQTLIEGEPVLSHQGAGKIIIVRILPIYLHFIKTLAPDLEGLRIVVDCASGMAALVAKEVWQATNADVTFINNRVDGRFPHHPPNPANSKNLRELSKKVLQLGADLGVAYDGDADRVAFVDESGTPLSPDKTIALFSTDILKSHPEAPIVFDQKCSRRVAETILANGGRPIREKSGHTFIKTAFITTNAPYAGELSGHHFFEAIHGDDGLYASLVLAKLLKQCGEPLSAMANTLPDYPITPDLRIPMPPEEIERVLTRLEDHFSTLGTVSTTDGIRVETEDGWGLARQSVTESMMTLRFEGVNELSLDKLIAQFLDAAPELQGKIPTVVRG